MTTFIIHKLIQQFTRHPFRTILIILTPELLLIAFIYVVLIILFGGGSSIVPQGCSSGNTPEGTGAITGTSGTWTKKGTRPYNLNKAVFEAAKSLGFNDVGAAGVVGCANNEGAGDLNAKGALDFGEQDNSGDGGKGIYQFTPGAAGGGTLEAYESWCHKHNYSPWQSAYVETKGIMAVKGYSRSKHPSSIEQATENWYLGCEDSAGWSSHAAPRVASAREAYKLFAGLGGTAADVNDGSESGSSTCGSSSSTDASDIKYAERYLGLPYQLGGNSTPISEGKPKSKVNPTDCNKFVWAVLKGAGYNVPSSMPGNCDDSIRRLHKYEVSQSQAKAGTVLITHDHAMIMMTPWRGINGTKIINEGGGQNDVNEGHSYHYCMASVIGDKRYYFNVPKK